VVDFESFRPEIETAPAYSDAVKGRRPPYDPVMMFRVLVIQAQKDLSDEGAEFLINDRLSFMRFLGLGLGDRVPDARTIWAFCERLVPGGGGDALARSLRSGGARGGPYSDVGPDRGRDPVSTPKQCNTQAEKAAIETGGFRPPGRRVRPSCAKKM